MPASNALVPVEYSNTVPGADSSGCAAVRAAAFSAPISWPPSDSAS